MKIYFILLTILLSGCAHKSAFDDFHITKEQELSVEQLQSSKLFNKNAKPVGLAVALYLNKINPQQYHEDEYFYISFYTQETNSTKADFLLNAAEPFSVEKLPQQNIFAQLTSINAAWMQNYLVRFHKQNKKELKLEIKTDSSSSRVLLFQKEE
jgi:hypothetical protein